MQIVMWSSEGVMLYCAAEKVESMKKMGRSVFGHELKTTWMFMFSNQLMNFKVKMIIY